MRLLVAYTGNMAPLVVPSVVRYSIVAELLGQTCINIMDVTITDEGIGTSRDDAINSVAGDIINNWDDHILGNLSSDYVFTEVRWLDLDSLDGSTGSRTSTDGTTLPVAGRSSGNAMPGHTYAKIRKNLEGSSRASRRGVLRLSGLQEGYVSGNNLLGASITALNAAFEEFKDGINGTDGGATVNCVVVHVPRVGPPSTDDISSFTAESVVGTIRRRMPGYGE